MIHSHDFRLAIVLVAIISATPVARGQSTKDPATTAAIGHFADNFDRFEFLTCNYTHRKAKSTNAQDAFAGKILPRQVGDTILPNTAIVQMVKDGKNVKYQQIADEESLAISLGGSGSLKPDPKMPGLAMGPIFAFGSSSELFNGIDSLAFTPSDGKPQNGPNTANLMGNGIPSWSQDGGQLLHVISAGGPYSLERMALASNKSIDLWHAPHRGIDCAWLTVHHPNGRTTQFALDTARGHIPICIIRNDEKNGELSRTEVTEIQQCSKDRWFPMRIVKYFTQGRGFWLVDDYRVTHLDVDIRPSRDSFMLDLPAGTAILDVEGLSTSKVPPTVYLKQNERIHPDDLPRLRELIRLKQADPLADTALPPKRIAWWKWTIAGVGAALVFAAVFWRIRSHRAVGRVAR